MTAFYKKRTSTKEIENDNTAKCIIVSSLNEIKQTNYYIRVVLKGSFTKCVERRKLEIENIFPGNLQNLINDLEIVDGDLNTTSKIRILNRCLPMDQK
ncbi:hypothetical protein H8356DRAFT_1344577 [Neocallimastix lanati (nom. inval.)]|nr:hypothetical protein H8356DRAFT_1344577 [Neocallimastix sp. JGI-2020a]